MHDRGAHAGCGKNFEWENDLLHEIRIRHYYGRRGGQDLGEEVKNREADKNAQSVIEAGFFRQNAKVSFLNVSENKNVKAKQQEGIQKRPDQSQSAALVPQFHVSERELFDEIPIPKNGHSEPEWVEFRNRRGFGLAHVRKDAGEGGRVKAILDSPGIVSPAGRPPRLPMGFQSQKAFLPCASKSGSVCLKARDSCNLLWLKPQDGIACTVRNLNGQNSILHVQAPNIMFCVEAVERKD